MRRHHQSSTAYLRSHCASSCRRRFSWFACIAIGRHRRIICRRRMRLVPTRSHAAVSSSTSYNCHVGASSSSSSYLALDRTLCRGNTKKASDWLLASPLLIIRKRSARLYMLRPTVLFPVQLTFFSKSFLFQSPPSSL